MIFICYQCKRKVKVLGDFDYWPYGVGMWECCSKECEDKLYESTRI